MARVIDRKQLVAETGVMLLEKGLVARTWGNTSARVNDRFFVISPSGLDYLHTEPEDVPLLRLADMEWKGRRKPSSEKGIHAAAYEIFPDVNFVIHTHQNFASALSLGGFEEDAMTEEEKAVLGPVAVAAYGLPGTKKLTRNVTEKFEEGSQVVLMAHHGVVICGADRDDALHKAMLLEEVCKRQIQGMNPEKPAGEQYAKLGLPLVAQLDDMAQMLGKKIDVVSEETFSEEMLRKKGALIVEGKGIEVFAEDPEDEEALRILTEKAAISALHTGVLGEKAALSAFDAGLMRVVYRFKYAKKKKG